MENKLPDVVWLSGQGNRLRDGQVDMGMCAYYRSDKAILKADAGELVRELLHNEIADAERCKLIAQLSGGETTYFDGKLFAFRCVLAAYRGEK